MEQHAYESAQTENEHRREVVAKATARITKPRMRMLSRALRGTMALRDILGNHPSVVDAEYLVSEVIYTFFGTDGDYVNWEYLKDVLLPLTENEHVCIANAPITMSQWAVLMHDVGIEKKDAIEIMSSCFDHVDFVTALYENEKPLGSVTE